MELTELEKVILARLKNNIQPSAIQIGVSSKEIESTLTDLKGKRLVSYDVVKDGLFKGDHKTVYLTPHGKEIAEQYNKIRL